MDKMELKRKKEAKYIVWAPSSSIPPRKIYTSYMDAHKCIKWLEGIGITDAYICRLAKKFSKNEMVIYIRDDKQPTRRIYMFGKAELKLELASEKKKNEELWKDNKELRDAKITIEKEYDKKMADFRLEWKRKEEHATSLLEIEKKTEILDAVTKVKEEYQAKEKELLETNFNKLSTSLEKIHSDGNAQTKFVKELSLKMIDKMSNNTQTENFNANANLKIAAPVEAEVEEEDFCDCDLDIEHCSVCDPKAFE